MQYLSLHKRQIRSKHKFMIEKITIQLISKLDPLLNRFLKQHQLDHKKKPTNTHASPITSHSQLVPHIFILLSALQLIKLPSLIKLI